MKHRRRVEWSRLDNASKIFPSTTGSKDSKVFRIFCELKEAVRPEILQLALNITIENFPLYKSVLRRGVFWYYFEKSDLPPIVEIESTPACAALYIKESRNLLFRVSYYNNRINLEVFHALSDGTGGLWFMNTLVYHYLLTAYKDTFSGSIPHLSYSASVSEKMDDSFKKHYTSKDMLKSNLKNIVKKPVATAYRIRGSRMDENKTKVIEGSMSARALLDEAHKYNTSLTVFTASLFLYSISKGMNANKKKRPVVLSVPINLRQFFQSDTARNFFSTMNISYNFSKSGSELSDIVQGVAESFKSELTEEKMKERVLKYSHIENNPLARIIPLPLKDYSLRIANSAADRGMSGAVSNVGEISLPPEFQQFITQFGIYTNARRPQITMCSYNGKLVITFVSPFRETEIQRTFFNFLSAKGLEVIITSNA